MKARLYSAVVAFVYMLVQLGFCTSPDLLKYLDTSQASTSKHHTSKTRIEILAGSLIYAKDLPLFVRYPTVSDGDDVQIDSRAPYVQEYPTSTLARPLPKGSMSLIRFCHDEPALRFGKMKLPRKVHLWRVQPGDGGIDHVRTLHEWKRKPVAVLKVQQASVSPQLYGSTYRAKYLDAELIQSRPFSPILFKKSRLEFSDKSWRSRNAVFPMPSMSSVVERQQSRKRQRNVYPNRWCYSTMFEVAEDEQDGEYLISFDNIYHRAGNGRVNVNAHVFGPSTFYIGDRQPAVFTAFI